MSKLVVELDDFVGAARSMRHEVAENVELCLSAVAGGLQPELVGVDPAGVAWAADYDPAVIAVLAASAQLANGAYKTSQLFAATGHNYALAEHASTTGGSGVGSEWTVMPTDDPLVRAPHAPPAGGAGHDTPADWWLVEHTIGVLWPGGHLDRLRATADTWRSAARGLDLALGVPLSIAARFVLDDLPEADDVRRICAGLYDHLTTLTDTYRALAGTCEEYATHLDTCHRAVEDELTTLARDTVITQAAGAALSVVTAGLAEIPTQVAQAARITAAANRIRALIQRLMTAARLIGTATARIRRIADDIHDALHELTTTRLAYAAVTDVPRLRHIQRTAMTAEDAESAAKAGHALGRAPTNLANAPRPFKIAAKDRTHVLDGDEVGGGGGHRWPGREGKTPFPEDWSDDQIVGNIEDIVSSPHTTWHVQTGSGSQYTSDGKPARWRAWEVRDGVRIRVVYEPANDRLVSSFPDLKSAEGEVVP